MPPCMFQNKSCKKIRGNDHEVEFHEIKICFFHEIKITIMRWKLHLIMRSKLSKNILQFRSGGRHFDHEIKTA
jgi:hypothetical protein